MTHQAIYSSLLFYQTFSRMRDRKREKELICSLPHFLNLKKIATIRTYNADPIIGLYIHYSDSSGFMLISFIIPKLFVYP